MKKIVLLFFLLTIVCLLKAQDTPVVAGVKFGTNIETAYEILKNRYGEDRVHFDGIPQSGEAVLSDLTLGYKIQKKPDNWQDGGQEIKNEDEIKEIMHRDFGI